MMPPVRQDILGWFDAKLHTTYSPAEAEHKFGSRIYDQRRPTHLFPIFEADAHDLPGPEDHWINKMRWDKVNTQPPSLHSRFAFQSTFLHGGK